MDQNRKNSWTPARTLAAVLLLGLFGSGYAISTHLENADASNMAIPAVSEFRAPADYFPAQYVNQAKYAEEHIQAF